MTDYWCDPLKSLWGDVTTYSLTVVSLLVTALLQGGRGEKLSTSDCKLSSVFWSPKTKATDIKSLKFQRKLSQLSCFLRIWFGKMLREEKHLMSWEVERLTTTLRIWIWQNCAQAFYKVFHWFIAIGHICRITFRQKCKQSFSYCHSVHRTQPWCI